MLRVACPGTPRTTPSPGGTVEGIAQAQRLGIQAMEIEWVQQVPSNVERMREIRAAAGSDFALTVHAPYFINLNADDEAKKAVSIQRILKALAMAQHCGAVSVCVHAAFYLGHPPQRALENVLRATEEILQQKKSLFPDVNLAYETMGKPTQFGTLEELLVVAERFGIYPCVDTAHMHARANGAVNTAEEWHALLDAYEAALGKASLQTMHLHYSGIAYGPKGEKHHLPLRESDARWQEFLHVLHERNVGGVLVCESPTMEDDTMLLRDTLAAIALRSTANVAKR